MCVSTAVMLSRVLSALIKADNSGVKLRNKFRLALYRHAHCRLGKGDHGQYFVPTVKSLRASLVLLGLAGVLDKHWFPAIPLEVSECWEHNHTLPIAVDHNLFARAVRDWATMMSPKPGSHSPLLQPLSVGDIQVVFKFLGGEKVDQVPVPVPVPEPAPAPEPELLASALAPAPAPAPVPAWLPASEPGSIDFGLGFCMHPEFSSFPPLVGFACTEEASVFDTEMWKFVRDHVLS
jgi:hypothetical protein